METEECRGPHFSFLRMAFRSASRSWNHDNIIDTHRPFAPYHTSCDFPVYYCAHSELFSHLHTLVYSLKIAVLDYHGNRLVRLEEIV